MSVDDKRAQIINTMLIGREDALTQEKFSFDDKEPLGGRSFDPKGDLIAAIVKLEVLDG